MKILLAFSTLIITAFCSPQPLSNPQSIEGKWISAEGNIIVQVIKTGATYSGRVVWFDDAGNKEDPMALRVDKNNPDHSLRQRKLLGMEVLTGLVYNSDDEEWQDGKIYDPISGKTWSASATIISNGSLNVRGFWHFDFLGKTMMFKRV